MSNDKLQEMYARERAQLITRLNLLTTRTHQLEQVVRNYVTVIASMPEFATASDYRRLLAPVQEFAQELLEQEVK